MQSITYKGKPNPKKKCELKIEMIFFKTGYNRVPKITEVIGSCKDWDQKAQQFRGRSLENKEKNKALRDLELKYTQVANKWERDGVNWSPREWAHCFDKEEAVKSEVKVKSVLEMISSIIENFSKKQRIKNGIVVSSYANIKEYKLLRASLTNFTKEKYKKALSSYFFNDIKEKFLTDYSLWLKQNGKKNGNNGAVIH